VSALQVIELVEECVTSLEEVFLVCLLKTLVSNCTFDHGSFLATYRKPFDMLVEGNENGNWLGGRDSFRPFQETPMKTGVFRVSPAAATISRFRILSSAFVLSRSVSGFSSAMTLVMTLAVNVSRVSLVESVRG